jgi:hypothetical protein
MEKLEALGGERGVGPAGKPVPYGLLSCSERGLGRRSARNAARPTAVVSTIEALTRDFVGMDGRVCRRLRLAGDAMGQRARMFCALSLLPLEVARRGAFSFKTFSLFSSRTVGSVAGAAAEAAWAGLDSLVGGNGNADTADVEQGRMGIRLLALLAWVVFGRDGATETVINREN